MFTSVAATAHVQASLPEPGQYRRTHLLALIESIRDKAVASGVIDKAELDHRAALADPRYRAQVTAAEINEAFRQGRRRAAGGLT